LQEKIQFTNLGLLIIDEEHRFGVKQKERLKAFRADIDILSMKATPIPRTLQMAMSQMREISLIATPPLRRLAIKSFQIDYQRGLVREAILREILRGGQVFFVHNDVASIEKITLDIAAMVPEAKCRFAHGQMKSVELEKIMADFYHQAFNVLVCTTIIETGIDIPSANTILIHRAHHFGLAQLHQLRGRVGRSHHQAYAYFIVPKDAPITADAEKRLDAILSIQDLGAGFILASNDLEIRGAGEILGESQSGQMQSIGFSLYMEFLNAAIETLKAGKTFDYKTLYQQEVAMDLSLPAFIPEDYLPDVHTRLIFYKKLADAKNKEAIEAIEIEMIDRFGLLPDSLKYLCRLRELKLQAAKLGIAKIQMSTEKGSLEFSAAPQINVKALITLIQQESRYYQLQGQQKLRWTVKNSLPTDRLTFIERLLNLLSITSPLAGEVCA
jgi:transcription-repair coupling factor (superfamily II helicase)